MEQKTKLSVLAILLIAIIIGSVYFILNKKDASTTKTTPTTLQSGQKLPETTNKDDKKLGLPTHEVSGKIKSITIKTVQVTLEDGKGFIAQIKSDTPVVIRGTLKTGSITDLKVGQSVTVKFNTEKTIQIMITK